MTPAHFDQLVDSILDDLPQWVVDEVDNLVIVVEEEPTAAQDPSGEGLLGLYEGVNLAERGDYFGAMPDRITIFRGPHLRLGLSRTALKAEVRTTVLHELAHHLGIDDDRLHDLGWD